MLRKRLLGGPVGSPVRLARGLQAALALTACGTTELLEEPRLTRDPGSISEVCEVQPPFIPSFVPELEWAWTGSTILPEHKQVMMTPVVVELNGDGVPDVVFNTFAGNNYTTKGILRAISGDDGHELWTVTAHFVRGASSIAAGDIDGDGKVELCTLPEDGNGIICFEHDGSFKFRTTLPVNAWGGPAFADLDNDGTPEIIIGNLVFSHTGALLWVGADGMGGPSYENPVIVDVDGDDNAEVLVAANTACHFGPHFGLRVFRDRNDGWVNTRRIWNQHAYSVTNVNDDGTLPARPLANWLVPGLNTFRSNSQGTGTVPPFAAPDLQVLELSATCEPGTQAVTLLARVANQGDAAASAGLPVAFYRGPPDSGGTLLGVATVPGVLPPGGSAVLTHTLSPAPGGTADIWGVADDDGTHHGRELECREENNARSAELDLTCVDNLAPVALCRDVTVSADAACRGNGDVDDGSYDLDSGPAPLSLSRTPPGPFPPGSHAVTLTAFDGELGVQCVGTLTVVDATPPALTCPAPQVLECASGGAVATFSAPAADNCGPAPTTCVPPSGSTFPVGQSAVTCTARDGSGNTAACTFTVTVRDTLPPTPGEERGRKLWPPSHTHHTVTLAECAAASQDRCAGPLPVEQHGRITHVTSDEVEDANGNGDGRTCGDMVLLDRTSVRLRAEREGTGDGRVYTVHYVLTDPAGNATAGRCRVSVPHDPSGPPAVDGAPRYCVGPGCPAGLEGSPSCP